MSLQKHTSATWRASARLSRLRALIELKTEKRKKGILIIAGLPNQPPLMHPLPPPRPGAVGARVCMYMSTKGRQPTH